MEAMIDEDRMKKTESGEDERERGISFGIRPSIGTTRQLLHPKIMTNSIYYVRICRQSTNAG